MIFYADDDSDDLELFSEIAAELDIPLMTFTNGEDLMEKLRNPPPSPQVVFLDINMPKYSGSEVLEEIRASEDFKGLPVVMYSTSSDPIMIEKLRVLGADLYIPKPSGFKDIKKCLKFVLSHDFKKTTPSRAGFVYIAR